MGISHVIFVKDNFELAVDENWDVEDRDISPTQLFELTFGTGFTSGGANSVNLQMTIGLDDLKKIRDRFAEVIADYESKCKDSLYNLW